MGLASSYKDKLQHFRTKELEDVLTQLRISKQGKKQVVEVQLRMLKVTVIWKLLQILSQLTYIVLRNAPYVSRTTHWSLSISTHISTSRLWYRHNECTSLLLSLEDPRADTSGQRSNNPFSFPREQHPARSQLYLSFDLDSN